MDNIIIGASASLITLIVGGIILYLWKRHLLRFEISETLGKETAEKVKDIENIKATINNMQKDYLERFEKIQDMLTKILCDISKLMTAIKFIGDRNEANH